VQHRVDERAPAHLEGPRERLELAHVSARGDLLGDEAVPETAGRGP